MKIFSGVFAGLPEICPGEFSRPSPKRRLTTSRSRGQVITIATNPSQRLNGMCHESEAYENRTSKSNGASVAYLECPHALRAERPWKRIVRYVRFSLVSNSRKLNNRPSKSAGALFRNLEERQMGHASLEYTPFRNRESSHSFNAMGRESMQHRRYTISVSC